MQTLMRHKDTGKVIERGDVITSFRGVPFIFLYGWNNRVIAHPRAYPEAQQEYFVTVFNLEQAD